VRRALVEGESGGVIRGHDVYDDEPWFRDVFILIGLMLWSTSTDDGRFIGDWVVHPAKWQCPTAVTGCRHSSRSGPGRRGAGRTGPGRRRRTAQLCGERDAGVDLVLV